VRSTGSTGSVTCAPAYRHRIGNQIRTGNTAIR
jgi:hypothetical protein